MDELISRQAAIDAARDWYEGLICGSFKGLEKRLRALPPAEPKKGQWIDRGERGDWEWQADGRGKHWHEWECNICHHYFAGRSFFCPHCGSDMRGVKHESN